MKEKLKKRTKRDLVMGVDPGFSGALALIKVDDLSLVHLIDIPTYKEPSKSRKSGHLINIDIHQLSHEVDMWAPRVSIAVVEKPGSMPGQGLSSTFRFGEACGQIQGVLSGHYIATAFVSPSAWKMALGLSSNKTDSISRANDYFPDNSGLWKLKKHNDRAESALLAVYGTIYLKEYIRACS